MDNLEDQNNSKIVDARVAQSRNIAKFAIVFSLILSIFSVGSVLSNSGSETQEVPSDYSSESSLDTFWAPAGFTVWINDSNIAYRWAAKNVCDNYDCISAEFISRDGCPSGFYAALNWLDSGDSVISYDNVSLPSLRAMQVAKLRFEDIEGSSKTGQIAEINCR